MTLVGVLRLMISPEPYRDLDAKEARVREQSATVTRELQEIARWHSPIEELLRRMHAARRSR